MSVLVDTNLFTRMAQPGHPQALIALNAVDSLVRQGHRLMIVPQVLYEFWVVAAMTVHGVKHLLTFNTADFSLFPGIQVIDPSSG